MTRLSSDSSFVQPAAWSFANHAFCSSTDNLHETEVANWTTSKLYNARTIHWKAAATITEPANHITISKRTTTIFITCEAVSHIKTMCFITVCHSQFKDLNVPNSNVGLFLEHWAILATVLPVPWGCRPGDPTFAADLTEIEDLYKIKPTTFFVVCQSYYKDFC